MAARVLLILVLWAVENSSTAQNLVADLSSDEVAITTGFTGTELLLFGASGSKGDIVVTVMGPRRTEVVRRKQRVAGIWVNGAEVTFENAPAYYQLASSKPIEEIAPMKFLKKFQIGVEQINLETLSVKSDFELRKFREALIRNKKRLQLYSEQISDIILVRGSLFRSKIPFPANVPTGEYEVSVYLFKKGQLMEKNKTSLTVRKVGIEARIYDFAHQKSALYGILAIAVALVAGWFAGVIFRRS